MPAPVNPVCAKPNPAPAVVAACPAAVTYGWYAAIPLACPVTGSTPVAAPVNLVAACCKPVCPATVCESFSSSQIYTQMLIEFFVSLWWTALKRV